MTIHNNNHGADWALLHDYQKAFGCRPDIVIPFMDYLRDQSVVAESAPLLVAWLDLLTGMASGEEGASTVFGSLLTDAAGKQNPVSWLRMLGVIREYCIRFATFDILICTKCVCIVARSK